MTIGEDVLSSEDRSAIVSSDDLRSVAGYIWIRIAEDVAKKNDYSIRIIRKVGRTAWIRIETLVHGRKAFNEIRLL